MLGAHQYTMSASSCRSSVPAATVRPSGDTSHERSALSLPSNGTAGRRGSLLSCQKSLSHSGAQGTRTLDRCGTRAVIPHPHDAVLARGDDYSPVCASDRVSSTQRCGASLVAFQRERCPKRGLVEQIYSVRWCRCGRSIVGSNGGDCQHIGITWQPRGSERCCLLNERSGFQERHLFGIVSPKLKKKTRWIT